MKRVVKTSSFIANLTIPSHIGGMARLLVIALLILSFTSCQKKVEHGGKHPVAQVNGKFFYQEDLIKLLPYGLSTTDSTKLAKELIRKWAKDQVLFDKAEHNVRGD